MSSPTPDGVDIVPGDSAGNDVHGAPAPPTVTSPAPVGPASGQRVDNGFAVAAFVLGILGLTGTLPVIGSLLAVIFGRLALGRVARGQVTEVGIARWGFWLGVAGLILVVLVILIVIAVIAIVGIAALNSEFAA